MKTTNKKGTWGGKRERKTKAEPTKVIRVPVSKLNAVYELLDNGKINTPHPLKH
jgi:hypothetical protein